MAELVQTIAAHRLHLGAKGLPAGALKRSANLVVSAARGLLARRLQNIGRDEPRKISEAVRAGDIDLERAVAEALKLICQDP